MIYEFFFKFMKFAVSLNLHITGIAFSFFKKGKCAYAVLEMLQGKPSILAKLWILLQRQGINTQVQSSNMCSRGNSTPAELREPHACPPWGSGP